MFDNGFAPATSANQISNVWDEFARGAFTFYITGPWSIGEFKRRLPAEPASELDDGAATGTGRPGLFRCGRLEPCRVQRLAAEEGGVAARSILVSARRPAALPRAHGQPAAAAQCLERRGLRQDVHARAFREQLERVKPAPKVPEWERIATEMQLVAEHMVQGGGMTIDAGGRRDRPTRGPHSREAALDAGAQGAAVKLNWAAWAFVAPALMVIAVFFFLPVLAGFALSFTDFDIYALADIGNLRFVGLANYVELLQTPLFWKALGNTLYFVGVGVPLSIAASLGAALLLNSKLARFKPFFRVALFAPVVTTLVAVAIVWRYLLHTRSGLINYGLESLGLAPIDWLGDPHWAMPAIILFAVWKNFGYNMIIFLAGLQSIPEELYEAARIDGASSWQQLRYVTLPSLAPVVLLVSVLTMAGYFQLFAEPYVMTQGGPLQSTVSVLYFMYEEGFKWWNLGFASAIAFVLFVLMFAVTMLQLYVARLREARMKLSPAAIAINGALVAAAAFALFPLVWMLSVSFMAPGEASAFPPPMLPQEPTLANYRELFAREGMGRYFVNSLLLATCATLVALTFNVMAGYAFAKLRFNGREQIFRVLLGAHRHSRASGDAAAVSAPKEHGSGQHIRRRSRAGARDHLRHCAGAPVRAFNPRRDARSCARRWRQRI